MKFEEGTAELVPADVRTKVSTEVAAILESVTSVKIETDEQFANSAKLTGEIKRVAKLVEENRTSLVKPRNDEVKEINAFFKSFTEKLDNAEATLKKAIAGYQQEMERKRVEAQRKADEEARKEMERIEAQARAQREKEEAARREQERLEAEKRAAEERARREQEEIARKAQEAKNAEERARLEAEAAEKRRIAEEEQKRLEAEAEKNRKAAETAAAKADAREMQAQTVVADVVQMPTAKAKGISTKTVYRAEIIDKKAFVMFALQSGMDAVVQIDEGSVNRLVNTLKGAVKWPGVEIKTDQIVSARAAA